MPSQSAPVDREMGSLASGGDGCARHRAHRVIFLPQGLLRMCTSTTLCLSHACEGVVAFSQIFILFLTSSSMVCTSCGASILNGGMRARHGPFKSKGFGADILSPRALATASFSDCSQKMAAGRELQCPDHFLGRWRCKLSSVRAGTLVWLLHCTWRPLTGHPSCCSSPTKASKRKANVYGSR